MLQEKQNGILLKGWKRKKKRTGKHFGTKGIRQTKWGKETKGFLELARSRELRAGGTSRIRWSTIKGGFLRAHLSKKRVQPGANRKGEGWKRVTSGL